MILDFTSPPPLDFMNIFDPYSEEWSKIKCLGPSPQNHLWGTSAVSDSCLYIYGKCSIYGKHGLKSLYQYNTDSNEWTLLWSQPSQQEGPDATWGCGMVFYSGDRLLLFGGKHEWWRKECTNEHHVFDLNQSEFSA